MPIDPLTEELLPFTTAANRLPRLRAGRPVSPATLWRWASHGLRGVKLEICRIGGTTCTSTQALRRFFARLSGEGVATAAPADLSRHSARTEATLDKAGI
jgi:hypothetical protein